MIDLEGIYDMTSGYIETPGGIGKFVEYDPHSKKVTVELDYDCLVELDASECYPVEKNSKGGFPDEI